MAKRGLGRGLSSLIPGLSHDEQENEYAEIETWKVQPNPDQPRKNFDAESLHELVESIKEFGIIQPVLVRKTGEIYQIVAGERRWRAAKEAGLEKIKVLIKEVGDKDALQVALIENIQRENLDAIEEAKAYHRLVSEHQMTQAEIASRLGKNRTVITNTLRLLSLPEEIKKAISNGHISSGHAKAILSLPNEKSQVKMAKQIMENNLSVRDTEKITRQKSEGLAGDNNGQQKPVDSTKGKTIVMKEIGEELAKHLRVKVQVQAYGNKGQIKIFFSTLDELTSLLAKLKNNGSAN